MTKYKTFIFKSYHFDRQAQTLHLNYSYDNQLELSETYKFKFDYVDYEEVAFDRLAQLIFFLTGVSYYKMYLTPEIVVEAGQIDDNLAGFLNKTYQKGLGEFFYVNQLDPLSPINFPINSPELAVLQVKDLTGKLSGLGGGKDSLVSAELLRGEDKLASWSLNHEPQLTPLVKRVGYQHFWVERHLDPKITQLNRLDAMNGHIPVSALFSVIGAAVSLLTGYRDNIVSNESSTNEPTLNYRGVDINHQYSKSLEYEKDFQDYLSNNFGDSLRYYSLLRPFSELRIAELFSQYFDKYKDVFSSCNRAYTLGGQTMFWCGVCPKCAFVFLVLTPFIDKAELVKLWHGKNLLLDPSLEPTYKQLLGIEGDKPLECVGEVKEARMAMHLAQAIYPELDKYVFDLPEDYDFRAWSDSALPGDVMSLLKSKF